MSRNIQDNELYAYGSKVKGQTVIITGAANGLGKATALEFGKRGANVVIGDVDVKGAEKTASEIKALGGNAAFRVCNVLEYDQIVALFEHAVSQYGSVDIVIPNAGVTEIGRFTSVETDQQGRPKKPNLKTMEINAISVLYTTHVTIHYFNKNKKPGALKSLVLIGSMASISGIPGGALYTTSKHGVLGLLRSLTPEFDVYGWRISAVTPWFADTNIVPTAMKLALAGVPMVPISRVAGAMFLAATDEEPGSHGAVYSLPDEREVFRVPHVELNEGVYQIMNDRAKRAKSAIQGIKTCVSLTSMFLRSSLFKVSIVLVVAYAVYPFVTGQSDPADVLSHIQSFIGKSA